MKELYIEKPSLNLTVSAIQEAEKELGVQFPESYRSFLLQHNGGRPQQSSFPLTEELLTPRGAHPQLRCTCFVFPAA